MVAADVAPAPRLVPCCAFFAWRLRTLDPRARPVRRGAHRFDLRVREGDAGAHERSALPRVQFTRIGSSMSKPHCRWSSVSGGGQSRSAKTSNAVRCGSMRSPSPRGE
jgi:hypothetical protein